MRRASVHVALASRGGDTSERITDPTTIVAITPSEIPRTFADAPAHGRGSKLRTLPIRSAIADLARIPATWIGVTGVEGESAPAR